jgi:hypothetical protein
VRRGRGRSGARWRADHGEARLGADLHGRGDPAVLVAQAAVRRRGMAAPAARNGVGGAAGPAGLPGRPGRLASRARRPGPRLPSAEPRPGHRDRGVDGERQRLGMGRGNGVAQARHGELPLRGDQRLAAGGRDGGRRGGRVRPAILRTPAVHRPQPRRLGGSRRRPGRGPAGPQGLGDAVDQPAAHRRAQALDPRRHFDRAVLQLPHVQRGAVGAGRRHAGRAPRLAGVGRTRPQPRHRGEARVGLAHRTGRPARRPRGQ